MPTGWKLIARLNGQEHHFVAQAPDASAAVQAVRNMPGMKAATITVSDWKTPSKHSWLNLQDGEARRIRRP
jgi:hypothetical protein